MERFRKSPESREVAPEHREVPPRMDDGFIMVSNDLVFPRSYWHVAIMAHVRGVKENDPSIMKDPSITFGHITLRLDVETGLYYMEGPPSDEVAPNLPQNLIYQVSTASRPVMNVALRWFVEQDLKMIEFVVENRNPGATGMARIRMWKGDDPSHFGIRYGR